MYILRAVGWWLLLPALSGFVPGCMKAQRPPPTQSNAATRKSDEPDAKQAEGSEQSGRREAAQNSSGQRIAIPDIEGCPRDKTTLYRGTVTSFRRTASLTEITVRTEWDTTEKLVQPNDAHRIIFRLDGEPMKDEDLKQIQAMLNGGASEIRATVWVCLEQDKGVIKIIDWQRPKGGTLAP